MPVDSFIPRPPSAVYHPRPSGGAAPDLAGPGLGTVWWEDSFSDRSLPLKPYGTGTGDNWGAMSSGLHSWSIFVTGGAGDFAGVLHGRGVGKHTPASGNVLNASFDTGLQPVHFMVDAIVRVGPDGAIGAGDVVNLNIWAHAGELICHLQIQRNAGNLEARLILENSGVLGAFGAFVAGADYHLRWEYNSIGAPNVERAKLWRAGEAEPGGWDVEGVPADPLDIGNERVVWQFTGLPDADLTFDLAAIRGTIP